MPYHKDCRHWAGGPRCMNWICHCMASQFDPKLQPFLSYYGDSNMCECENKDQADAWLAVWETLMQGNPKFHYGNRTGQGNAVAEIKRLYEAEKHRVGEAEAWKAAHAHVLGERNNMIDQRDAARSERDGESRNKNAALRELDKEREKHTETLKLLEKERETGDRLTREVVKLRTALQDRVTLGVTAPVMGGGADTHRHNVRQAVQTFANHPRRVAEAVYYLLDRDQLQTAAIKHLSERLDTLEPNSKQAAGCPMAPWEMRPSGDFNPG